MQITLSLLQNPWKNVSVDCLLGRRIWRGVNAGKTKIMICCTDLDLLQSSG